MAHIVDVGDRVNPARKAQIVPDQSLMALVDCYNKSGRQFVDKSRSLLNAIDHGEPEDTCAATVQLDKIVHAWWEQALAANTAKPEMVRAALATRMDTNSVSKMPIGVISKALQDIRLSASQKDIIATAYRRYQNSLPSVEKRKDFLQQLNEAASNDESSKQEESGSSRCTEVLRELGACFMNTQQACMALTTTVWTTMSLQQMAICTVACYPHWSTAPALAHQIFMEQQEQQQQQQLSQQAQQNEQHQALFPLLLPTTQKNHHEQRQQQHKQQQKRRSSDTSSYERHHHHQHPKQPMETSSDPPNPKRMRQARVKPPPVTHEVEQGLFQELPLAVEAWRCDSGSLAQSSAPALVQLLVGEEQHQRHHQEWLQQKQQQESWVQQLHGGQEHQLLLQQGEQQGQQEQYFQQQQQHGLELFPRAVPQVLGQFKWIATQQHLSQQQDVPAARQKGCQAAADFCAAGGDGIGDSLGASAAPAEGTGSGSSRITSNFLAGGSAAAAAAIVGPIDNSGMRTLGAPTCANANSYSSSFPQQHQQQGTITGEVRVPCLVEQTRYQQQQQHWGGRCQLQEQQQLLAHDVLQQLLQPTVDPLLLPLQQQKQQQQPMEDVMQVTEHQWSQQQLLCVRAAHMTGQQLRHVPPALLQRLLWLLLVLAQLARGPALNHTCRTLHGRAVHLKGWPEASNSVQPVHLRLRPIGRGRAALLRMQ